MCGHSLVIVLAAMLTILTIVSLVLLFLFLFIFRVFMFVVVNLLKHIVLVALSPLTAIACQTHHLEIKRVGALTIWP